MTGKLRWGACSEIGLVRQINEDSKWHEPPLFAVADGMGGHSAGDVASAMAIEEISRELRRSDSLSSAVHAANRAIFDKASKNPELAGMGTTITALFTNDASAQIAHVGDSRAYLLHNGTLSRLTTDHTVVGRLVQQGRLMQEDADRHPQRSYLERALGVDSDVEVDVHVLDFSPEDRVLLCSDGLFGMIDDDLILEILQNERDPQRAAERLCEEAVHAGGNDNVTCIVVDFPPDQVAAPTVASTLAQPTVYSSPRSDTGPMRDSPGNTKTMPAPHTRAAAAPSAPVPPAPQSRPRRRGKILISLSLLLVVLGAAAFATTTWINNSWYVGNQDGSVTIFNGPRGEVIGMELSDVHQKTPLAVESLPEIDQVRLQEGITAKSRADAESVVRNLEAKVSPIPDPGATPTPPPEPAPAAPAP
jgi:PPM family protein phosphatase